MDHPRRLPIDDPRRISARDAKVLAREEAVSNRTGASSVRCPCNICLGEVHSKRRREMVAIHLREVGRYPFLRGRTRVRSYITCMLVTAYVISDLHYAVNK